MRFFDGGIGLPKKSTTASIRESADGSVLVAQPDRDESGGVSPRRSGPRKHDEAKEGSALGEASVSTCGTQRMDAAHSQVQ